MAVAVGIDPGTTNSVIAATEAGKPTVIRRHHAEGGRPGQPARDPRRHVPVAHYRRRAECSGYWPGTAAFHVNADIADAVISYSDATGDHEFTRRTGLDVLTATAGSGGRSASTTRPAASASTASPARMSTRPWWTTTCTPT